MRKLFLLPFFLLLLVTSCEEPVEHIAKAIHERDSVALMSSYGVNTLISDSGVIKYRIVAERWDINPNVNPSRWIFEKGVFLEQFDEKFHVNSYIQCDTAYYFDQQKLWELRGDVHILTKDGLRFWSEELYWDELNHQLYSNVFSRLVTPERTLQGNYFRSDERMTKYFVSNTKGSFVKGDLTGEGGGPAETDSARAAQDSIQRANHPKATPQAKSPYLPMMH